MKVNFENAPRQGVKFFYIKKGDAFGYEIGRSLRYFLKTEATPCSNCVDIENGNTMTFEADDLVMPLHSETNVWY